MGQEEQKEEREVLDSIYTDEITDISDTAFTISIKLDTINADGDTSDPPTILLHVSYPEAYPDEAPEIDISAPQDEPSHPYLDVSSDKARILEELAPVIEENMGMAMVFTLVSTIKEAAEQIVSERQASVRAEQEEVIARAEQEENKKFHGTPVTKETFLEWRNAFMIELQEDAQKRKEEKELDDKKKRIAKEDKKMTGRELWEKGLVGKVEEDYEDDGSAIDIEQLRVSG
ncbi:MAG: hypothetical protein M1824_000977 [Vezdaea acicularis]|nr:MAG: hypothetical protein M1824_000977 [Vezdaea acicularis]